MMLMQRTIGICDNDHQLIKLALMKTIMLAVMVMVMMVMVMVMMVKELHRHRGCVLLSK